MHLVPFGYHTKLGAKWAELVQKFMQRSRIITFRNEHTRLTPLGPTHVLVRFVLFGCIWYHLVALQNSAQNRRGTKVCAMKSCRNFSQQTTRSTPLDPNIMFRCVSYYLDAFGQVWLHYNTQCKMGQPGVKVRATKSRRNFSQRTHPIHSILL